MGYSRAGNLPIADVFTGSTQVYKMYYGSELVWKKPEQTLVALVEVEQTNAFLQVQGLRNMSPEITYVVGDPPQPYIVDWGDGIKEFTNLSTITHNYATPGVYTLTLYDCHRPRHDVIQVFRGQDSPHIQSLVKVREILSYGDFFKYGEANGAFFYNVNLTSIPSSWEGFENVTYMGTCFKYCTALESIPSSWEGLGSVKSLGGCFSGCVALQSIPSSWEGLHNLESLNECFQSCIALQSIPSSWEGLDKLIYMGIAFENTGITQIPTVYTDELANVTSVNLLFRECTYLTSDIYPLYDYLSNKAISINNHELAFNNCVNATNYNLIPSDWK